MGCCSHGCIDNIVQLRQKFENRKEVERNWNWIDNTVKNSENKGAGTYGLEIKVKRYQQMMVFLLCGVYGWEGRQSKFIDSKWKKGIKFWLNFTILTWFYNVNQIPEETEESWETRETKNRADTQSWLTLTHMKASFLFSCGVSYLLQRRNALKCCCCWKQLLIAGKWRRGLVVQL